MRIIRDNNWTNISSLTYDPDHYLRFDAGTWNINTTPNTNGIFTRKVNVFRVYRDGNGDIAPSGTEDTQTKLITITVSWSDSGQTLSKTLSLYLMDIFS